MNKDLFNKIIIKSAFRQRLIAAGMILAIVAILLYQFMLGPYVLLFNSLYAHLRSQENLLALKTDRIGKLAELNNEYAADENKLQEVNRHFFSEAEASDFMKQLPKVVAGFGNRVLLLQPRSKVKALTRGEKLRKFVRDENLPAGKELIDLMDKNQTAIESGETANDLLIQVLNLLPENKKEQFKTIWEQERGLDFYEDLKLREVDIEVTIQGKFTGTLSLFEWFDKYDKIINLSKIQTNISGQTSGVETRFTLSIYMIE